MKKKSEFDGAILKRNRAPFLWLSNKVFKKVEAGKIEMSPIDIAVLCALAYHDYGDARGVVYPSEARICQLTGIKSPQTVRDASKRLIKMGLIIKESGKSEGRNNIYHLRDDR